MLDFAEVHMPFPCWKPSRSPRSINIYSLNPVSGCSARQCVHTWRFRGDTYGPKLLGGVPLVYVVFYCPVLPWVFGVRIAPYA